MDGLYTTDAEAESTCYNFCTPYMTAPGFVGMQWNNMGTARCICHFDDGLVPLDLPAGVDVVSDWSRPGNVDSVGPVVGNSAFKSMTYNQNCYPYKVSLEVSPFSSSALPSLILLV